MNPKISCNTPAMTTATRKISNDPNDWIDVNTITARPAAGPLTPNDELLSAPTTIPPTIPAIIPENNGAPLASAIPKHSGIATKNTTILAGMSCLTCEKSEFWSFKGVFFIA